MKKLVFLIALLLIFMQTKSQDPASTETEKGKETTTEKKPTETLSYFRFRIYSDFVGVEDDQPNGLIQTEFYWSWRLARKPLFQASNTKVYLFYNLVVPEVALLKIDEKERFLPVLFVKDTTESGTETTITTTKSLNTIDILKYANFRSGIKLNVVTLSFPTSRLLLDTYFVHYRTGIKDSTLETSEKNINSFGAGFNALYHTGLFESRFKLDVGYSIFWLRSMTNSYQQISSSDEVGNETVISSKHISHQNQASTAIYSQVVMVPQDASTEYFLRISYTSNFLTLRKPEFYNGFVQFQVGISKDIDFKKLGRKE